MMASMENLSASEESLENFMNHPPIKPARRNKKRPAEDPNNNPGTASATGARLKRLEETRENLRHKMRSTFTIEGVKMPKKSLNALKTADARMCWKHFKDEVCAQLLGEDFVANPFVEYSQSFDLGSVYYKPKSIADRCGLILADIYYLDNLANMMDPNLSSTVPLLKSEQSILIQNEEINQAFFFRKANISNLKLKSCEIHIDGSKYQSMETDLVGNAFYFDMIKERLEGMTRCYIITEVVKADVVFIKNTVQPATEGLEYRDVNIAFRYKKFGVEETGRINGEMKTNMKRRSKAKAFQWHPKKNKIFMFEEDFPSSTDSPTKAHPLYKELESRTATK